MSSFFLSSFFWSLTAAVVVFLLRFLDPLAVVAAADPLAAAAAAVLSETSTTLSVSDSAEAEASEPLRFCCVCALGATSEVLVSHAFFDADLTYLSCL